MGAPEGNTNSAKGRKFYEALNRALTQEDGKRVREAAEQLLNQAAAGEQWAIKELADRLDGKPSQTIAGDAENPLNFVTRIERAVVKNAQD